MKEPKTIKPASNPWGWIAVGTGVAFFIVGIVLRTVQPGTIADTRLLEGFGILLTGWGIIPLVRSILARRNPAAAHRAELEEKDERAVTIRNQAAYVSYLFTLVTTSLALLVYSALTRGQPGFDIIWAWLGFMAVAPSLVFAGMVIWLNINKTR